MSRQDGGLEKRPERVIIVDADDPMREVHGRFVWQDEHDRVVAEVRRRAFEDGFHAGRHDASSRQTQVQIELRRRSSASRAIWLAVVFLAALSLLLMLPLVLNV